ncbi:membrane protein of unknown function [Oenococcus oeni]|uniref:hypothetical protein n=1 Tax=Oenococcus oeni TaxID=1247 RepID=UPI0010B99EC7|nr:hypothetical protein [Oenococcus oeni]SYW00507.1 membrane hypothetical protein [Oenococcus oeni]SYW01926.1 membrane hypothetical protein [Oenococcus oeni]SYW18309.1 membrane hypothetical protein [Oenococcus oeni]VDC14199.1 membrane protein of unknown function [Oenococcus oeni]
MPENNLFSGISGILKQFFSIILLFFAVLFRWLNSNNTLDALIALSSSVLALLIPLVILVVEINRNSGFALDNQVFFNELINPKKFIKYFVFITITLIFWHLPIKPLILIFYVIGIYYFLCLLIRLYNWISAFDAPQNNFKNLQRKNYLKDEKISDEEAVNVWNLIWSQSRNFDETNMPLPFDLTDFLDIFKEKYVSMKKTHSKFSSSLLSSFVYNFDGLSFIRIDGLIKVYQFTLQNLFSNLIILKNERQKKTHNSVNDDFYLFNELMESLLDRTFAEQDKLFIFFDVIKKELKKNKNNVDSMFISRFGMEIFQRTDKLKRNEIFFSNFPNEWKINSEKLRSGSGGNFAENVLLKENFIPTCWYRSYLEFLEFKNYNDGGLSMNRNEKFNSHDRHFLQELTTTVLEYADPILFAELSLLSINGPEIHQDLEKKRLIYLWVTQIQKFGFASRTYSISVDDDEKANKELARMMNRDKEESLKLSYLTFRTIRDHNFMKFVLTYLQSDEIKKLMEKDKIEYSKSLLEDKTHIIKTVLAFLDRRKQDAKKNN